MASCTVLFARWCSRFYCRHLVLWSDGQRYADREGTILAPTRGEIRRNPRLLFEDESVLYYPSSLVG